MDFPSFLLRQHWLKLEEYGPLAWLAIKSNRGEPSKDGYLEPSLYETDIDDLDDLRPYPFGDVLKNSSEVLPEVLKRADIEDFDGLVDAWHQWHVDRVQPLSDYCLSPQSPKPFGKKLYDQATEKRLCGNWIAEHVVGESDHVVIPEGTSTFWVGLAVLSRRSQLQIITSNGAIVRELQENPRLLSQAVGVSVIGGEMDVKLGGSGRGFIGEFAQEYYEESIKRRPGATVVVSSVNGFLPDTGPYAPCPKTGMTRYELIMQSLGSNVRKLVFVADHTKMRPGKEKEYGTPIFSDSQQWRSILKAHHERLMIVVTPPREIRENTEIMSVRPRDRVILGKNYPQPVMDYLKSAKRFDEMTSADGLTPCFFEAVNPPSHDQESGIR